MKTSLIFMALLFTELGCQQKDNTEKPITFKSNLNLVKTETNQTVYNFKNPAYGFGGSSFFAYFSILKQTGRIEDMLDFTSQKSIQAHGRNKIIQLYSAINFNFEKRLVSIFNQNEKIFVLNYKCSIMATTCVKSITVILERDSCKLLLPDNLNGFLK